MPTLYEQSKNQFIEKYEIKHKKLVDEMIKNRDDIITKYGDEIGKLETLLANNGFSIVGFGENECTPWMTTMEKKCYYKVQKNGCSLIFNLVCAVSSKYDRPYLYIMGTIDRTLNTNLPNECYFKITNSFQYGKINALWLTADDFAGLNAEFIKLITALGEVKDIASFDRYAFVRTVVAENVKTLKAFKKLV